MKKSGKKLCALALAAAMLGLTACGSSSGTTDTTTAAAGGAAATEETTAAAAVAEGESVSQDTDIIRSSQCGLHHTGPPGYQRHPLRRRSASYHGRIVWV